MDTFHLTVITPEHQFFEGQVSMLKLTSLDGELGIMAGHEPMVVAVDDGEIDILQNGVWRAAANGQGYATITQDVVLLMLQTVEWPEEIDIKRAERAAERAKERLRQKASVQEYLQARTSLSRAMARLRVSEKSTIE